jgi:hypothetical protein
LRHNRELERASNRSLDVGDELRPICGHIEDLTFVTSDVEYLTNDLDGVPNIRLHRTIAPEQQLSGSIPFEVPFEVTTSDEGNSLSQIKFRIPLRVAATAYEHRPIGIIGRGSLSVMPIRGEGRRTNLEPASYQGCLKANQLSAR